jgi:hypothetical protein
MLPSRKRERNNNGRSAVLLSGGTYATKTTRSDNANMRLLLALIVIIYLVGVGVILSPTVRSEWNSAPASVLAENIARELPDALAWPVRAARGVTGMLPSNSSRLSAN